MAWKDIPEGDTVHYYHNLCKEKSEEIAKLRQRLGDTKDYRKKIRDLEAFVAKAHYKLDKAATVIAGLKEENHILRDKLQWHESENE